MRIGLSLVLKSATTNLSVIRTLKRGSHIEDILQIKIMLSCRDFIVIYSCKLPEIEVLENLYFITDQVKMVKKINILIN